MITYAEILIVGDMPDQIALVSKILHAEGYRVFAATSGPAARHVLEQRLPDLILMDIQMKDVSGLEICRRLKASPRTKDVPVVFLTAEADSDTIALCFELGANDYIIKPFIKAEFLSRIKTQLRLASQRRELVAANDELSQFTIAVTHDLKAPFNVVNMLISKLQTEIDNNNIEQAVRLMGMVSDKSAQARIMIERLFEFSKLCNVSLTMQTVNTRAITRETFDDLMSLQPEDRQVKFTCGRLPNITADEALFRMAIKNLLINALKYSSKKPKSVIRVYSVHDPSYYIIKVKDNGAGFDMRYAGKIFKVFERLHTDKEFPGTGVGLALVSRIMERHSGRIEAYGEVEKGAEITLYFPKSLKPAG